MRLLLVHAGRARPIILHPFAVILSFLLAYAWYLIIVGIILPLFVQLVGRLELRRRRTFANARAREHLVPSRDYHRDPLSHRLLTCGSLLRGVPRDVRESASCSRLLTELAASGSLLDAVK